MNDNLYRICKDEVDEDSPNLIKETLTNFTGTREQCHKEIRRLEDEALSKYGRVPFWLHLAPRDVK